jgi:hypothetical protein
MKTKFLAGLFAALALAGLAGTASAQAWDRGGDAAYDSYRGGGYHDDFRGGRHGAITIRNNGRNYRVNYDDGLFYRLLDRPFHFQPGFTYAYTDRCNRNGCVVFVYDGHSRRPSDRIFAAHLPMQWYRWSEARDFDRDYDGYGYYSYDDRRFDGRWGYSAEARWDQWRNRSLMESGPIR